MRRKIATEAQGTGSDGSDRSDSDTGNIPGDRKFVSRKRKNKDRKRMQRLKLDEAIRKGEQGDFAGWSEARIRAWKLKDKNPNAYYYRFNDPGEEQHNGPWTKVIALFHF